MDDLIGRVRAALRVGAGQHHAVPMFQQLFKNRLPCVPAPGGGGLAQAGNIQHRRFGPQRGGSLLRVLAIEHHELPNLDAHQLVRVLGFQIPVLFCDRREVRFHGDSIIVFRLLRRTRLGGFQRCLRRGGCWGIGPVLPRFRMARSGNSRGGILPFYRPFD